MFLKFVNVSISNLMSRSCKPLKKKSNIELKFVAFGRCDVGSAYTSEFDLKRTLFLTKGVQLQHKIQCLFYSYYYFNAVLNVLLLSTV